MRNLPRVWYYLNSGLRRLHWSSEKLQIYQEKHLRLMIKHAYESVPFYHEKFKKANISPSDITRTKDLEKVPVLTKDELRKIEYSSIISTDFSKEKLRVMSTSGSTGQPVKVFMTGREDDWRKAIYLRANVAVGQKLRDRWVVITVPRLFGNITRAQRWLGFYNQRFISVFSNVDEQIDFIKKNKPDVLDGFSGTLYLIAKRIEERGLELPSPRLMFGSAELIDVPSRKYLEKVFGAPFYDQFGCAEVDRSAWQCTERDGYHMDVDSVITEFVDQDGTNVQAGEEGQIVLTSLFNYAMPLIRYSVGDVGRPSNEGCPCGKKLPLMEVVEGRRDSYIVLPDGQLASPRMFFTAVNMSSQAPNFDQFRVIQRRNDLLEFDIKKKSTGTVPNEVLEKELLKDLRNLLKVGQDMQFQVKVVEDIPLTEGGKLAAVISEVKRAAH